MPWHVQKTEIYIYKCKHIKSEYTSKNKLNESKKIVDYISLQ